MATDYEKRMQLLRRSGSAMAAKPQSWKPTTRPSWGSGSPWGNRPETDSSDSPGSDSPGSDETDSASPETSLSGPYQESAAVKQAQELLQQQLAQKPGAYQSTWQQQLDDAIDRILNREKFSYDLNGDALWQQYKDQYVTQGRMAMMDTMGQAQAMTGGYGNSYAQSVGQQAYQGYLQGLNDRIPELYNLALSRYQLEGDQLAEQYAMLQSQEDQAYGRYQDDMSAWLADRDFLQGRYDTERNYDYGLYADNRDYAYNKYVADRNFAWQQEQAAQEQARWEAEFAESQRQFNEQMAKSSSSGGGGGGGGGGGSSSSSSSSSGSLSSYDAIATVATNGASSNDVAAAIAEELVSGNLTQAEAQDLRNKYTDRSNSIWYQ